MRRAPSSPNNSPAFDAFPSNAARSAFTFAFVLLVIGAGRFIAPQCTVARDVLVLNPAPCGKVNGEEISPPLIAEMLRIHPEEPESHLVLRVVHALEAGEVVSLPTDTFYGLAVDPVNLRAVDRLYDLH